MRKTIYHEYKQTEHIRKALSIKLTEPIEDSMYALPLMLYHLRIPLTIEWNDHKTELLHWDINGEIKESKLT